MEDAIIDQELDDRVVKALNSDALGDTDDYFDLIQLLQSKDEPMVVAIFKTLKIAVASISRVKHHTLLQAISEISLWNCGPLVIKAACKFIVVLPMVAFVKSMLWLDMENMRGLVGNPMIVELVKRLIDLDLEIPWDTIKRFDVRGRRIPQNKKFMERRANESELVDIDEDEYCGREYNFEKVLVIKLDELMGLMFDHLQRCFKSGCLVKVFEALLHSFDIRVLTAYKPNFSQFLMFYACSLDRGAFGSRFESMLLDTFKSPDKPRDQRKCAVRYLGSYVSRARFVSTSEAIIILKSLVDWCSNYCNYPRFSDRPVFYAACDAFMQIICFLVKLNMRPSELKSSKMKTSELKSSLISMPLKKIFDHHVNPTHVKFLSSLTLWLTI